MRIFLSVMPVIIVLNCGCSSTSVNAFTPISQTDMSSRDDIQHLNDSTGGSVPGDSQETELSSGAGIDHYQSDTQSIYDKILEFSRDYHCHFRHTQPQLLFNINKRSDTIYNAIIKNDTVYIVGSKNVVYELDTMTPKYEINIDSGLLINNILVDIVRPEGEELSSVIGYEIPSGNIKFKICIPVEYSTVFYYGNYIYMLSPWTSTMGERLSPPARLYKYTINGELVWDVDLETIQRTPHSMLRLFVAYENKLFLTDDHAFLIAYDATDGHEIWYQNTPPQGGGGIDVKNGLVSDQMYMYDINTGKVVWRKKMIKHAPCVHIGAISDGIMFTNESCDGPLIAAYDNLSGELLWRAGANDGSDVDSNIFVAGDLLISGFENRPDIIARNKYTGEIVWQFAYREDGQLPNGRIFCQDDWLFVVDDERVYVYGYRDSSQNLSTHSANGEHNE